MTLLHFPLHLGCPVDSDGGSLCVVFLLLSKKQRCFFSPPSHLFSSWVPAQTFHPVRRLGAGEQKVTKVARDQAGVESKCQPPVPDKEFKFVLHEARTNWEKGCQLSLLSRKGQESGHCKGQESRKTNSVTRVREQ